MKKIFLALLLLTATQVTYAQHARDRAESRQKLSPEQRVEMKADRLEKELGLSADQKEAIKAIDRKSVDEIKEVRSDNKVQIQEVRMQNDEEYKKVLTEEQYIKYQQLKVERKERMERRKM